jgi:hypothetical protein
LQNEQHENSWKYFYHKLKNIIMSELANYYKDLYEKEKQKSHDHFSDVLNLSRQIGAYRSLLTNLLIDLEDKSPYIPLEYRKKRIITRMAELQKEFDEMFNVDETK